MYKKCENCYKDGKTPNEESCKKCEDDLKAKEQECERLKLIVAHSCHDVLYKDSLRGQLDQLKAENENLKEMMHKARCPHYVLGECSQEHHGNCVGKYQCIKDLEQEIEKLKNERKILDDEILVVEITEKQFEEYQKLKQTLRNIKEIAESCGWNFGSEILYKRIEYILQKISEVVEQ